MPSFRPWIGKHHINTVKTARFHDFKQGAHIIRPDTNIAQIMFIYLAHKARHPVDEWLSADKSCLRIASSKLSKMLTSPKTDFQK